MSYKRTKRKEFSHFFNHFITSNCDPFISEHFLFLFALISQLLEKIQGLEEKVNIYLNFTNVDTRIGYEIHVVSLRILVMSHFYLSAYCVKNA